MLLGPYKIDLAYPSDNQIKVKANHRSTHTQSHTISLTRISSSRGHSKVILGTRSSTAHSFRYVSFVSYRYQCRAIGRVGWKEWDDGVVQIELETRWRELDCLPGGRRRYLMRGVRCDKPSHLTLT